MYKSAKFELMHFLVYGDGVLVDTAPDLQEAYQSYLTAVQKFKNVSVTVSERVIFDLEQVFFYASLLIFFFDYFPCFTFCYQVVFN